MDWSKEEVELIVASYFEMFRKEYASEPYNKTEFRKALIPLLNGRTNGSIEFKHQNISAVLAKLGLPYIKGYKPKSNLQGLLEDVVSHYIQQYSWELEPYFDRFVTEQPPDKKQQPVNYLSALKEPPTPVEINEPPGIYRAYKTNFLEREQNNRILGEQGEAFVINYERQRLEEEGKPTLADQIEWVSKERGDGLGYDILSKNIDGTNRFIEVKTTKLSKETPFFVSQNELNFASQFANAFYFYRVYDLNSPTQLYIRHGKYENHCQLKPVSYKAYIKAT